GPVPYRTGSALAAAVPDDLPAPPVAADGLAAAVPGFVLAPAAPGSRYGRLLTVAAVHTGSGAVAGYTEVLIPPAPAARAQQCHTAVVPVHRRRGLGRWLTAEMLRRLHAEHPQITEVETAAADGDAGALALDEQLGFRPYRRTHGYRLRVRG
ncbi:GNAT family N-acetyltransferase, partial [Streptomyces sp. MAR4 CNX-425]|uniref:GNAT family N-acetyltransferase n=1 Tax=Streptomyces sp. MAR4 CNX-425 TaxID=3406343 RepID=UPI003B50AAF0